MSSLNLRNNNYFQSKTTPGDIIVCLFHFWPAKIKLPDSIFHQCLHQMSKIEKYKELLSSFVFLNGDNAFSPLLEEILSTLMICKFIEPFYSKSYTYFVSPLSQHIIAEKILPRFTKQYQVLIKELAEGIKGLIDESN